MLLWVTTISVTAQAMVTQVQVALRATPVRAVSLEALLNRVRLMTLIPAVTRVSDLSIRFFKLYKNRVGKSYAVFIAYFFLQVDGANASKIGKISSLPKSIVNDKTNWWKYE